MIGGDSGQTLVTMPRQGGSIVFCPCFIHFPDKKEEEEEEEEFHEATLSFSCFDTTEPNVWPGIRFCPPIR